MARTDAFAGIAEFLAVAELGSFRAAAGAPACDAGSCEPGGASA
jgi:hypothetical protein